MKRFFAYFCGLGALWMGHLFAYKVDVKEKWPSPTPWIRDRFTDFLDCMPKGGYVVEVGVQGGAYAACLLNKTNPKQLFLVDCWEHQDPAIYDDLEANVSNEEHEILYSGTKKRFAHDPRVVVLKLYSKEAAKQFLDESLDLVYIDANHSYEAAKQDLACWWPKVKKNGFLAGHDYIKRENWGVVQAVNEFLNENDLYFDYLTTQNNYESWAIQKPIYSYKVNVKEKWPSPTPWLRDRFTDFLDCMPKGGRAVEVGVQGGAYAACILKKTHPKQLFLVDCWEHQDPAIYDDPEANVSDEEHEILYNETRKRFVHDPRVIVFKLYSEEAAKQFQDESLDFVYIDANHSYEAVKNDLACWWPKIKKKGFLAGHDYIKKENWGVVQAVNEFLREHDLYFEYLTTENNYESWAIQKPSE